RRRASRRRRAARWGAQRPARRHARVYEPFQTQSAARIAIAGTGPLRVLTIRCFRSGLLAGFNQTELARAARRTRAEPKRVFFHRCGPPSTKKHSRSAEHADDTGSVVHAVLTNTFAMMFP